MAQGNTTTDHDSIRKWAEARGGQPTRVRGTEGKDGSGILRIDFDKPEESLEQISWEDFFETFEDRELAFLYQDKTADGHTSRFFKFVHRSESGGDDGEAGRSKANTGSSKAGQRGREAESDRKAAERRRASGGHEDGKHQGGQDDLKSREYKDDKGEVHHHTRTYMEEHAKK